MKTQFYVVRANQTTYSNINALLNWSIKNGVQGVEPYSNLTIFQSENGTRGIITKNDIAKGETVIRIPMELCIAAHESGTALPYEEARWDVCLACRILKEIARGPNSQWKPYLASLPPFESDHFVKLFDMATKLEYPPMISAINSRKNYIIDAYSKCSLSSHGGATMSTFFWAMTMVYSRSFTLKTSTGSTLRILVPIADMLNHGEGNSPHLLTWQKLPSLETHKWVLSFTARNSIPNNCEALISYGKMSNDLFLLNYGFVPYSNTYDEVVLFEDCNSACYWWITCFGKALNPKQRTFVIQSFISGTSAATKQLMTLNYKDFKRKGFFDASSMKYKFKDQFPVVKEFKIYSGGLIDARMKVAFVRAWMAANLNFRGSHAVRLAEISIAIRSVQALASFNRNLLDDLHTLSSEGAPLMQQRIKRENKYYMRLFRYYRTKLRNTDTKDCSLSELDHLAHLLRYQTLKKTSKPEHFKSASNTVERIAISFQVHKKIILLDTILMVRVTKLEAGSIITLSFKNVKKFLEY